ncbi:unnamed protein product [Rotaria magnacalcarata]|uniref:Ras-related protein Rab n=3 Tax=Rotaria magnacalcarata TaxID=392030 RepID=A0A819D415_9BILA|nr:unnamed protein product [Rotaria magnacalcarata]CAF3822668.1 unnamed protein product [Rotaria magnacalcarata]
MLAIELILDRVMAQLQVTVVEAKNLKKKDTLSENDPFVEIYLDDSNYKQKTKAKKNAKNPKWNQSFVFNHLYGQDILHVEVYDEDSVKNDKIGSVQIDLHELYQKGHIDQWFELKGKLGLKSHGQIHLDLYFERLKTSTPTAPTSNMDQKKEYLFKVLVIGELATGKTALVKRYVHNFFSEHYRATIGVDFALKIVKYDDDTVIRLQLWDIAGQERFGNMTRVYYKEAVGCFIVFDVTRGSTFEAVTKWKTDLDNKVQLPDGNPVPCVLLANKCDLAKEGLVNNAQQMDEFCRAKGFANWFETSAKENINIETSARFLISEIMKHTEQLQPRSPGSYGRSDTLNIPGKSDEKPKNERTCCGGGSGNDSGDSKS